MVLLVEMIETSATTKARAEPKLTALCEVRSCMDVKSHNIVQIANSVTLIGIASAFTQGCTAIPTIKEAAITIDIP